MVPTSTHTKIEDKPGVGRRLAMGGLGGLLGGLGLTAVDRGSLEALGMSRFYHGTSDESAKKILVEGLLPRYGGNSAGSGAVIGGPYREQFRRNSKGMVHLGPEFFARAHARLVQVARDGGTSPEMSYLYGAINPLSMKGTVLPVYLPSEDLGKFKLMPDPDMPVAYKTRRRIGPEHIGALKRFRIHGLLKYIRNNPGRASLGAAAVGAGGYGTYAGAKMILDAYKGS